MNKVDEMHDLINQLKEANEAYYKYDNPILTDQDYDALYDRLEQLERMTGIILAGSPTQKVQGYLLDGFKKVRHSKPMLSADKTKNIDEIKKFVGKNEWYCSGKLDGLTLVTIFEDGKFMQGITRGDGLIGEDVTDACRFIKNLPLQIPYKDRLELRGECVMSWDEFNRINENSTDKYSHPRNLAAGTLRQLDLNVIKQRELSFVVFECVTRIKDSKLQELYFVHDLGFETVMRMAEDIGTVDQVAASMTTIVKDDKYPYDGLIFEIDSNSVSEALGGTGHHESCRKALKWQDDLVETTLRDIEWSTSKTGAVNPVAVFDEVDLGGAMTSRATLHNLTYIKDLELGIGDTIQVLRSNLVIPRVHDNLTRSNNITIPSVCPVCGSPTEIRKDNESEVLYCTNSHCPGRSLGKFKHFVSRKGMDISGLSEETLRKFVDLGWIERFSDIYNLGQHYQEMINLQGFGKKSVDKLMQSIEESRHNVSLQRFITSLSIPGVGEGQSKCICRVYKTWQEFLDARKRPGSYISIEGIGPTIDSAIRDWLNEEDNMADASNIAAMLEFESAMNKPEGDFPLLGKTFVVTGKVMFHKNRDEIKEKIERLGGKVAGSVSKNTSFLINNDVDSVSGKNKKAKELGIPVISEEEFLRMTGEK